MSLQKSQQNNTESVAAPSLQNPPNHTEGTAMPSPQNQQPNPQDAAVPSLQLRNYPPTTGIRVPSAAMCDLISAMFTNVGMRAEDACFMAALLVQNDLRCVFSHGTKMLPYYVPLFRQGKINPRPQVQVVDETPTTAVLDGDGGLGHFPCHRATQMAIAKARQNGLAAATTRNHFHFGSAGKYSRLALPHDCIGLATSSHRFPLDPAGLVLGAASVSPISIALPAGEQPPLVLDMGAGLLPHDPALFSQYPSVFFKSLGLGAVFQALGGILAGIWKPDCQQHPAGWQSNQGAFIAVFDIARFMPVSEFKREMDRYISQARAMQAFPGTDRAELPGGLEWAWEKENSKHGIPVGPEHQEVLEQLAGEMDLATPFAGCEHTRF